MERTKPRRGEIFCGGTCPGRGIFPCRSRRGGLGGENLKNFLAGVGLARIFENFYPAEASVFFNRDRPGLPGAMVINARQIMHWRDVKLKITPQSNIFAGQSKKIILRYFIDDTLIFENNHY